MSATLTVAPAIAELDVATTTRLRNATLASVTKAVDANTRPALAHVGFTGSWAAATDSFRLHAVDLGTDVLDGLNLDAKTLRRALASTRKLPTTIERTEDGVIITRQRRTVLKHRPLGMPNWRQLLPGGPNGVLTVDATDLAGICKRAGALNERRHTMAPLTIDTADVSPNPDDHDGPVVWGEAWSDGNRYREWAPASWVGDVVRFTVNPRYLADLLTFAGGKGAFSIRQRDELKPLHIEGPDFTALLMPVRV